MFIIIKYNLCICMCRVHQSTSPTHMGSPTPRHRQTDRQTQLYNNVVECCSSKLTNIAYNGKQKH